jgi:hypothetical protein
MKRTLKFLGFGLLLTAVLALAVGGTALAADRDQIRDQLKDGSGETCTCDGQPLRDGSCSDCSGDQLRLGNGEGDDCIPNLYSTPGPHGKHFVE